MNVKYAVFYEPSVNKPRRLDMSPTKRHLSRYFTTNAEVRDFMQGQRVSEHEIVKCLLLIGAGKIYTYALQLTIGRDWIRWDIVPEGTQQ